MPWLLWGWICKSGLSHYRNICWRCYVSTMRDEQVTPIRNIESKKLVPVLDSRIKVRGQPGREGRLSAKSAFEVPKQNKPSVNINLLVRLLAFLGLLWEFCHVIFAHMDIIVCWVMQLVCGFDLRITILTITSTYYARPQISELKISSFNRLHAVTTMVNPPKRCFMHSIKQADRRVFSWNGCTAPIVDCMLNFRRFQDSDSI